MNERMEARAVALVMDKEVEYVKTDGNIHYFKGIGHGERKEIEYIITAEILPTNNMTWHCECDYPSSYRDCKHTLACNMLMKQMIGTPTELREEYIMRVNK